MFPRPIHLDAFKVRIWAPEDDEYFTIRVRKFIYYRYCGCTCPLPKKNTVAVVLD